MALNGIDISGWQPDIDVERVPADFVIVKATEGTSFVSNSFKAQADGTLRAGKLLGLYHYINGVGAEAEMRFFHDAIKPYLGKAVVCLDWEDGGNSAWGNLAYLRRCIEEIKRLTGLTIVLYASASVFPWDLSDDTGCKRWVAQYADYSVTGYQATPWNEGAYECFIRQYSSTGRLSGYDGNLDVNKCYGNAADWNALTGTKNSTTASSTVSGATTKRRNRMECIFQPNGEPYMVYYDGVKCHKLAHPDEVTAINTVHRKCVGTDIPIFAFGTKSEPWATRFMDAVNR